MINLFKTAFIGVACIYLSCCSIKDTADFAAHPNVILILTDDQGYGDLSLHGNDSLRTPNLDFLGSAGARFETFYVSPVCAPTRASLLTGRYHLRTGTYWVTRGAENMNPEETTIAEIFSENGYRTGCFGKWHNGAHFPYTPRAQGFDEFIGFKAGHWSNYFNTELEENGDTLHTSGYITDVLTDKALAFIEENRENPFFCYIPYNAPHTPYQVPDAFFGRIMDRLEIDDTVTRTRRSTILGMCENIDMNVGRIIQGIEDLGLTEQTIFIFMTDNGPNGDRYNGHMRGKKGSVHEGGVRVPCFFYWKGKIEGGKSIDGMAAHIDILPTLVNLCELSFSPDKLLDGTDLSGFLLHDTENTIPERKIYHHQNHGSSLKRFPGAIRNPQYRFVITGEDQYSLFDMINDPGEKINIAEQHPGLSRDLYADYINWFNEVTVGIGTKRIIPVGYPESPVTYLPAHEAVINAGLSYKANINGWAHDWIVDWDQKEDTVSWHIEVVDPGEFEFVLQYNATPEAVGSVFQLTADGQSIRHALTRPFNSEIYPHHDRLVRQVEAFEKAWAYETLGKMQLEKGNYRISLNSPEMQSEEIAELKGVIVKRL
jgi:arylsulfatase A